MLIDNTSPDDAAIYFIKHDFTYNARIHGPLVRWDIASQEEKTVATPSGETEDVDISVDGRWLTKIALGATATHFIQPISGGEWKTVASTSWGYSIITPDGNSILYTDVGAHGRQRLYRVPIGGGEPRQMGELPDYCSYFTLSHDGRQFLCASSWSDDSYDLWALENFVPNGK
jgi:Tol biopolymer transport system component